MCLCVDMCTMGICVHWVKQWALETYEQELKTVISSHLGHGNWLDSVSLQEEEMFLTTEPQTQS